MSRNVWKQQTILTASDASNYATFGYSVDIDGNNVVVGAVADTEKGSDAGAAYVFSKNRSNVWSENQKLTLYGRSTYKNFGYDVSIKGNKLAISAVYKSLNYLQTGVVYTYTNTFGSWSYSENFSLDSNTPDAFGQSVVLGTNGLLIGAPQEQPYNQSYVGAVYYYSF